MREQAPDPHAARREERARKRRHGMRVRGASARLLARLQARRDLPASAASPHTIAPRRARRVP
jgi:hypothetical protein